MRLCSNTVISRYGVTPSPMARSSTRPNGRLPAPGTTRGRRRSLGEHAVDEPELVVQLHGARLHGERPRLAGRPVLAVDDDRVHAEAREAHGEHESARARADHEHVRLELPRLGHATTVASTRHPVPHSDDDGGTTEEPAESLVTVIVALMVNALIAVAKSFAAVITGSASMVAEAAHSWADTGNEVLLVIAERRSRRPADARHPLGFGKDAYIWSMFAAFGLFTAGAVVSIQHGISELVDPEPASDYGVAYACSASRSCSRGSRSSGRTARRAPTRTGGASPPLEHVARSSNPTLRAVFAEDAAALIGLVLAFLGVGLHQLTGSPVYDAIGSLLVGVLLGVVAVVLIARNRAFLLGEAVDDAMHDAVRDELLESPEIDRVGFLHMEFIGPGVVLLVAAVDLVGDRTEADAAANSGGSRPSSMRRPHVGRAFLTLAAPEDEEVTRTR